VSPLAIARALQTSNQRREAGSFAEGNQEFAVEAGSFLHSAEEARKIVVAVQSGRPLYLGDVATVTDGPEEPADYVYLGTGGATNGPGGTYPAVTLTVAKRKGANATNVSQDVLEKMDSLHGYVLPNDVQVTITRNYG
jgi:multidrug efflux pump subunit AcrB